MTEGAAAPVANAAGADGSEQPQQQSAWSTMSGMMFRFLMMWMFMQWIRGGQKQEAQTAPGSPTSGGPAKNRFPLGTEMSLWVFVNEEEMFTDFSNPDALFWRKDGLVFGDWTSGVDKDGIFSFSNELNLSENVQNNGSIYMHTYLTKSGYSPSKSLEEGIYDSDNVVYRSKRLNRYKKRTIKKTQNLLTGKTSVDEELLKHAEKHGHVEMISHWHPNITVNLVVDQTPWSKGKIPAPLDEVIHFDATGTMYEPVVYLNEYWNLLREFTPINDTVKSVTFRVTFQPISLFKLQMYVSQNQQSQWQAMFGEAAGDSSDADQDAMKEAILETNPIMLGLTVVVSIVHSIFEFLAFKNDIQFWKSRKTLEGLSVRSILWGIVQSLIVFLYVLDNDTNFVIRVSIFVGMIIDGWKITKVVSITLDHENKVLGIFPRPVINDKSTYVQSDTKKYDELAFKYLGMLFFPLLVAYCCYSLAYEEHKGVYSFILSMLYGFLLTFGFIMMTPQLFINYKLKSVAHLPWRMLTYKALNTFIDDIFAFVIKMPTLYRIGCFRDDIVFFIYLYQRYKYRVDPKRVNEFGTTGEPVEEGDGDAQAAIEEPQKPEKEAQEKKND